MAAATAAAARTRERRGGVTPWCNPYEQQLYSSLIRHPYAPLEPCPPGKYGATPRTRGGARALYSLPFPSLDLLARSTQCSVAAGYDRGATRCTQPVVETRGGGAARASS